MIGIIKYNPVWEYKFGKVIKEETDFITLRIIDKYNPKLSYDLRLPRLMVETKMEVAKA